MDAAAAGGVGDDEFDAEGGDLRWRGVGEVLAVAAEGGEGAVEDSAVDGVLPREGPVPVGLGAFVAAFVAEGGFVEMDEVAVEGVEKTLLGMSVLCGRGGLKRGERR